MVQLLSKPLYNRWYAQVRLINTKRGKSFIKDLFYDIDTWPRPLIEIFVTPVSQISYHDRWAVRIQIHGIDEIKYSMSFYSF